MCWFVPLIIGAVAAVAGSAAEQKGIDAQNAAQIQATNFNSAEAERQALLLEGQAKDAIDRGEADRLRYMREFQQEQGARAADLGASGVDVNSGSALDILADSAAVAALDAKTIRHNAAREAFGYREQAGSRRVNAAMERNAARYGIQAGQAQKQASVLNAVGSMASMWGGGIAGKLGKGTAAKKPASGATSITWYRDTYLPVL